MKSQLVSGRPLRRPRGCLTPPSLCLNIQYLRFFYWSDMSAALLYEEVGPVEWQRPFSADPKIPCPVHLPSHREHLLGAVM